jgi:osmoprotectant transport system ATP-binding protein
VDDFVAAFVGRDRGFRSLSFASARDLPLLPAATATAGTLASVRAEGWLLMTDDGGAPLGWLPPGERTSTAMVTGGSLFTLGSSLRQALDAALSSPSGQGVAVDAAGRVAGLVEASDVLQQLELERRG